MRLRGHRKSIAFFSTLGACLVGLALTLNVSWIVLNWREGILAVLGFIFFLLIIAGLVLNTIFLVDDTGILQGAVPVARLFVHEGSTPLTTLRL